MKLIRIEAVGFKSFANRMAMNFDGKIVGIVGPNGSGKSNISDAIRWVLGEQSKKNLRSKSMQDVIFAGSKGRQASDFSEVSLTFDNSDKQVNIAHRKFTITRRITRGDQSKNEYFINGEPARLRDLIAIAMESGIGKSSLAIISQGTVSTIADSQPEQRRFIFEEAAGTSHYRARKKEALTKLMKISENLEKLEFKTSELKRTLNPLKRQSSKAIKFQDVQSRLSEIEVSLLAHDIENYTHRLDKINDQLGAVISGKDTLSSRIEKMQSQISAKLEAKYRIDHEIQDIEAKGASTSERLFNMKVRHAKLTERRKVLLEDKSNVSKSQFEAVKHELSELDSNLRITAQYNTDLESGIEGKQQTSRNLNALISKLRLDRSIVNDKLYRAKSQREMLKDYEKNRSNLSYGTKVILDNKEALSGVHDAVVNIIRPLPEYQTAIETVLRNALQNIVVETSNDAIRAVNFLKKNRSGTATFIPLNVIRPRLINRQTLLGLQTMSGFIGEAVTLVEIGSEYAGLNEFLLGGVLVAKTIEDAQKIAEMIEFKHIVVALDGDLIRPGGIITGGKVSKRHAIMTNMAQKIKEIDEVIPKITKIVNSKTSEINNQENLLHECQNQIIELRNKLDKNLDKERILRIQFDNLKARYETISKEKLELENVDSNVVDIQKLEVKKSDLKTQLELRRSEVIKYNDEIQNLTNMKVELETKLFKINEESSNQLSERTKLEFYIGRATKRLAEQYETTFESVKNAYNRNIDIERARQEVNQLRKTLKGIGTVNVDAVKDFEKLDKRHRKLCAEQEELSAAKEVIDQSIAQMDKTMSTQFLKAFEAIQKNLEKIFVKMFGGGKIRLELTNPEDLLETGIEIIAQAPGKTVKSLRLFSGGEKTLIALSLLFAILEYQPLPLCILDEAEAALDELNIQKFANYIHTLKEKTQFIIVTHRVATMERLDLLYGATMQTPGITSIFSVEMQQAQHLIQRMASGKGRK